MRQRQITAALERLSPITTRVVFRNKGLIDMTAVRTLGVSVKDEGAIGYFGTGLKFAIATILRGGGSIIIWRGMERFELSIESETVREKSFDVVTLNGVQLGFTTQLGRDWEPWMAFRELVCNATDEGGSCYLTAVEHGGSENETVIEVIGGGIIDAYHDRHEIILQSQPLISTDVVELHPGPSAEVYYRGVRVGQMTRPSFFRYNILRKIALTEDRTFKWLHEVYGAITGGLLQASDLGVIQKALTCGNDYLEHFLDFEGREPTPEFLKVAGNLRADLDNVIRANPSAMNLARERKLSELGPQQSVNLTPVERQRFDRATSFLAQAGYDLSIYPVVIVDDLGAGVYGLTKEGKIFIARAAFQKGTKEVASTLLEEFVHLKTGFSDETRQLQTWLFDELLSHAESACGVVL